MAQAQNKTQKTVSSVNDFLNSIDDETKRADSKAVLKLMKEVTKEEPKMWGSSIIGFGDVHLKYESGRELDWFKMGFSPRKQNIALYSMDIFEEHPELFEKLGKHKTGKGCLYINKLADINIDVFKEIMETSLKSKS